MSRAGSGSSRGAYALHRLEVKFAPNPLALPVDERVGVVAAAVHETVAGGNAAVREQNCHLVQRLRAQGPEVPLHVLGAYMAFRMTLLGVNEHGELVRVPNKKHRGVVPTMSQFPSSV
jgi:hypothetical protein